MVDISIIALYYYNEMRRKLYVNICIKLRVDSIISKSDQYSHIHIRGKG
jgi:hypothetical protein